MKIKRLKRLAVIIAIVIIFLCLLALNAGKKERPIYGVTFSPQQAADLGLDWKKVYVAMLEELKIKNIRIAAYWNQVQPEEGKYNFSDLDFEMDMAAKYDARVVLGVGRRLPRWPECFEPEWAKKMDKQARANALQSYIETTVKRYYNHPALEMWQVENEAFLSSFGECPELDVKEFDAEIELVRRLDPGHKILITDSGELSLWWQAGRRGDVFGTTLYRYVYSDVFNRYWVNYIPYWFYRVKAGALRLLRPGKEIIIIELQAEPWTTKGIVNTPIEEQFKTMSMEKFEKLLSVAKATGFSPQYLWGVEWWYWMREQNHPEFWQKAQNLMND